MKVARSSARRSLKSEWIVGVLQAYCELRDCLRMNRAVKSLLGNTRLSLVISKSVRETLSGHRFYSQASSSEVFCQAEFATIRHTNWSQAVAEATRVLQLCRTLRGIAKSRMNRSQASSSVQVVFCKVLHPGARNTGTNMHQKMHTADLVGKSGPSRILRAKPYPRHSPFCRSTHAHEHPEASIFSEDLMARCRHRYQATKTQKKEPKPREPSGRFSIGDTRHHLLDR
jgi:hypothetical protein